MTSRYFTEDELRERFWAKVDKNGPNGCWLWTAAKFTQGYGCVSIWRKVKKAHRVSWEWANGPIPDGLTIDHLCGVRHCVRPEHLEPVTAAENSRRGSYRKVGATHDRCRYGHPRNPGETRGCPTCRDRIRQKDRMRARNARVRTPRKALEQRALARQKAQIGDMLFHPERHGFSSRDEAIAYLWPTEPGSVAA